MTVEAITRLPDGRGSVRMTFSDSQTTTQNQIKILNYSNFRASKRVLAVSENFLKFTPQASGSTRSLQIATNAHL